ncbi:hypothetical protein L6452_42771 [Arctium lappa]|uniref:Uncharacterized protein n=1 Tax=Arctium lappa TaxID=4217 RepID=A0ACB8XJS6_ARCLA|nr:hypothetical protein L6452_42771 [Arctium lappa]
MGVVNCVNAVCSGYGLILAHLNYQSSKKPIYQPPISPPLLRITTTNSLSCGCFARLLQPSNNHTSPSPRATHLDSTHTRATPPPSPSPTPTTKSNPSATKDTSNKPSKLSPKNPTQLNAPMSS